MQPTSRFTKHVRKEDVNNDWWIIDATNKTLGRLATQAARLLRGKHKPSFTPHVDNGDYVVIINADKIQIQAKRAEQKEYFHYTGYPGGGRFDSYQKVMTIKPEFALEHAIKGMLPKNRLGRKIVKKLKVYTGEQHPHSAQMPKEYSLPY